MKKLIKATLVILLSGLMSTSALNQTVEDLKEKISNLNHEMIQAMLEGNTEKSLSYYTDDAISMPNNGKMVEGIEAIRKSTQAMASSGVKVNSFDVNTLYAMPCENMIIEVGKFKISMVMPGMSESVEDEGKYVTIWEKQSDGSLKIKLETWNTDSSPLSTPNTAEETGSDKQDLF